MKQLLLLLYMLPLSLLGQANYMFLNTQTLRNAMKEHTHVFKHIESQTTRSNIISHTYRVANSSLIYTFYSLSGSIISLRVSGASEDVHTHTDVWVKRYKYANHDTSIPLGAGAYYLVPDPYDVLYVYHVYTVYDSDKDVLHRYLSINEYLLQSIIK